MTSGGWSGLSQGSLNMEIYLLSSSVVKGFPCPHPFPIHLMFSLENGIVYCVILDACTTETLGLLRGLTYGKANLDSSCVLVGASSWIYSRLSRAVNAARWPGCEIPSQVCEATSLQRCRNRKAKDKITTYVRKEASGLGKIPKLTVLILKAFSRLKEIVSLHF